MTDDKNLPENPEQADPSPQADEPAVIVPPAPKSSDRPSDKPVATVGGNLLNYLIIAGVFLAVGLLLGMNFGGNDESFNETQLRLIIQEELARIDFSADTQTASLADDDPFFGPEDAPVTIVEFSDFLCSFCGRHFDETLTPLLDNYDGLIRYVYRDFPGVGGQNAVESALAAECAADQDMFWEYHDRLFSEQDLLFTNDLNVLRDVLINHATTLELNVETFTECLDNDQHMADILRDRAEGSQNGMSGTPGFFINGIFLSGAQPYEMFAAIIDAELEEAGIEPPDGGEA